MYGREELALHGDGRATLTLSREHALADLADHDGRIVVCRGKAVWLMWLWLELLEAITKF